MIVSLSRLCSGSALGLVLGAALFSSACSRSSSTGGTAATSTASAADVMPLDVAAYRNFAEHPHRYHEIKSDKTTGDDARTTRTYPAVGLGKETVDVQIVESMHTAWSIRLAGTKAAPAQFGKLEQLYEVGGATWYRITNDALEGCYLVAQPAASGTNIVIDSPDYVGIDNAPAEKALADWLKVHGQDAGH
ncbi:MAG TPA: hypothetical protein VF407_10880 [Polyangiaceae bacterium]